MVRTTCAVDPDAIAQALAVRLRGPVSARVVEACDPSDDHYRPMAALVATLTDTRLAREVASILHSHTATDPPDPGRAQTC